MIIIWVNHLHSSNANSIFQLLLSFILSSEQEPSVVFICKIIFETNPDQGIDHFRNFSPLFGGITISHAIIDPAFWKDPWYLHVHWITEFLHFLLSIPLSILGFLLPVSVSSVIVLSSSVLTMARSSRFIFLSPLWLLVQFILYILIAKLSSLILFHYLFHIFS